MKTNPDFTLDEWQLVSDAAVLLRKNAVMGKIMLLMQDLQQNMAGTNIPEALRQVPPKISRGEQYLGLPWVMLDYPRLSGKEGICFIRTMFWWGNFFSSTLHLSGSYASQFGHIINKKKGLLDQEGFSVAVGPDPWQHHFEKENYQPLTKIEPAAFEQLTRREHIKIAAAIPLEQWPCAANTLMNNWKLLLSLVTQPVE